MVCYYHNISVIITGSSVVKLCFCKPKVPRSIPLLVKTFFFNFFSTSQGSRVRILTSFWIFTAACCRHLEYAKKFSTSSSATYNRWKLAHVGPNGEKLKKRDIFNTLVWTKFEKLFFFKHLSSKFEKYFQTNMYPFTVEKWLPKSTSFFSTSK